MSDKGIFSAVRCFNVKSIQALSSAREHAFRRDENSQKRVDLSRTDMSLVSSEYAPDNPRDVVQAFRGFKERTGIKEQKGASVALHMLCVVSPEWLQETGDPRDPENPRVKELFKKSQEWAEQTFGAGSVIASRLDVDEAGSGVVDVFVCPSSVVGQRNRPGQDKRVISTRKALKTIQREYKQKRSFTALQDSFAEFCQSNLDERIQRGIPKDVTQREHVHADIYRPALASAKKLKEKSLQIYSDAERDAKLIRENARREGLSSGALDFAERDYLAKLAIGASLSALDVKKQGRDLGREETTKLARKEIRKKNREISLLSDEVKTLKNEKDSLSSELWKNKDIIYKSNEKISSLEKSNQSQFYGVKKIANQLDNSNINPNPFLKVFLSLDEILEEIRRDCMGMMRYFSLKYEDNKKDNINTLNWTKSNDFKLN